MTSQFTYWWCSFILSCCFYEETQIGVGRCCVIQIDMPDTYPILTSIRDTHMHIQSRNRHGPLARYVKLELRMRRECFPPPLRFSEPDMHHGTCVTHVPWCMTGSLTSGFLWNRCRGKRSRHSRRMRNPRFSISGKRPIALTSRERHGVSTYQIAGVCSTACSD